MKQIKQDYHLKSKKGIKEMIQETSFKFDCGHLKQFQKILISLI